MHGLLSFLMLALFWPCPCFFSGRIQQKRVACRGGSVCIVGIYAPWPEKFANTILANPCYRSIYVISGYSFDAVGHSKRQSLGFMESCLENFFGSIPGLEPAPDSITRLSVHLALLPKER